MVQQLAELKAKKEAADDVAKAASAEYEAQRKLIIDSLNANKRSSYEVDGAGWVYISSKEVYRVPKTNEDKTKLFNYIKEKYGPETLMGMVGIHSGTLTSWANEESASGVMSIPGLEAPTMVETLNFRRK